MVRKSSKTMWACAAGILLACTVTLQAYAEVASPDADALLIELESPAASNPEKLIKKSSDYGYASYYAKRFEGRRTSSGQRYNPEKMTAAHQSLPFGTVVRVVNQATNQEVHVTVNDRCARKTYPFIDLSRAAAKKIGLWGKGKIKVAIIPLLDDPP